MSDVAPPHDAGQTPTETSTAPPVAPDALPAAPDAPLAAPEAPSAAPEAPSAAPETPLAAPPEAPAAVPDAPKADTGNVKAKTGAGKKGSKKTESAATNETAHPEDTNAVPPDAAAKVGQLLSSMGGAAPKIEHVDLARDRVFMIANRHVTSHKCPETCACKVEQALHLIGSEIIEAKVIIQEINRVKNMCEIMPTSEDKKIFADSIKENSQICYIILKELKQQRHELDNMLELFNETTMQFARIDNDITKDYELVEQLRQTVKTLQNQEAEIKKQADERHRRSVQEKEMRRLKEAEYEEQHNDDMDWVIGLNDTRMDEMQDEINRDKELVLERGRDRAMLLMAVRQLQDLGDAEELNKRKKQEAAKNPTETDEGPAMERMGPMAPVTGTDKLLNEGPLGAMGPEGRPVMIPMCPKEIPIGGGMAPMRPQDNPMHQALMYSIGGIDGFGMGWPNPPIRPKTPKELLNQPVQAQPPPGIKSTPGGAKMPQSAMIPQPGGMMPQPGGMMPQPGGMMPQSGGMTPQPGEMMPQPGGMMPQPGISPQNTISPNVTMAQPGGGITPPNEMTLSGPMPPVGGWMMTPNGMMMMVPDGRLMRLDGMMMSPDGITPAPRRPCASNPVLKRSSLAKPKPDPGKPLVTGGATNAPDGPGSPNAFGTDIPDGPGSPNAFGTDVPDGPGSPNAFGTDVPDGPGGQNAFGTDVPNSMQYSAAVTTGTRNPFTQGLANPGADYLGRSRAFGRAPPLGPAPLRMVPLIRPGSLRMGVSNITGSYGKGHPGGPGTFGMVPPNLMYYPAVGSRMGSPFLPGRRGSAVPQMNAPGGPQASGMGPSSSMYYAAVEARTGNPFSAGGQNINGQISAVPGNVQSGAPNTQQYQWRSGPPPVTIDVTVPTSDPCNCSLFPNDTCRTNADDYVNTPVPRSEAFAREEILNKLGNLVDYQRANLCPCDCFGVGKIDPYYALVEGQTDDACAKCETQKCEK